MCVVERAVPGHPRRQSDVVQLAKPPSITPRPNRAQLLRQGSAPLDSPFLRRRPSTSLGLALSKSLATPTSDRPSSVASTFDPLTPRAFGACFTPKEPSIAPRTNRAAELRAKKKAEEDAAKAKLLLKSTKGKIGRPATALGTVRTSGALTEIQNSS